jgi:hypothetical protein
VRFGTWNVRSQYRAGPLITVTREIAKYKLDSVEVQEVRWDRGGTEPAGDYAFVCGNGNENRELGTGFFVHKGILSADREDEFVSGGMLYITLRGRWYHVIILNIHASI